MKICVIATESVTYAMKGQQLLEERGIRSKIIRLTGNETKKGCGYGIELLCSYAATAADLFTKHGIPFSEIIKNT